MTADHILVIGFGGPEKAADIRPFLEQVTRGIPIPSSRLDEVAHHYEAIGGRSPYNDHARRLVEKLTATTASLPVFLGMRNWHPFLKNVLGEIKGRGLKKGIGVILAAQRSDASYDRYLRAVEEAKQAAGAVEVTYEYLKPWFDHPLFIEAQASRLQETVTHLGGVQRLTDSHVIFTAHSIPLEMAEKSQYAQEIHTSASLVAKSLGVSRWSVAYQSRSGSPRQPWLEPDILTKLRELKAKGGKSVLVVPIGFVSDNAEVLYDLDIEARREAHQLGLEYARASTVMDHPKFVAMFVELLQV